VLASYGHIKDLPAKQGSVLPERGFAMRWQPVARAAAQVDALEAAARGAGRLVLATDPDREGEAISWHVLEELKGRGALGSR
jgi:DNA topoisomerase-1